MINKPIFDHERRDVYRLSIGYVAFSYQVAKTLDGMNRPALECASIYDALAVCDAVDGEANRRGKSDPKRIVSMLARLIQRTETV